MPKIHLPTLGGSIFVNARVRLPEASPHLPQPHPHASHTQGVIQDPTFRKTMLVLILYCCHLEIPNNFILLFLVFYFLREGERVHTCVCELERGRERE